MYKHFVDKIAVEQRIGRKELKDFLTLKYRDGLDSPKRYVNGVEVKKYKNGLSTKIVDAVAGKFSNYTPQLLFEAWIDGLSSIFNQDEKDLKKLAFKIFDINND